VSALPQFWLRHLEAIAEENITTKAYAEREGLPVWRLYDARKKLAQQRKADGTQNHTGRRDRGFVSVALQLPAKPDRTVALAPSPCHLHLQGGTHLEFPRLPDVHWLSQLISALTPTTGGA
jgi:hypothetical protein